MTGRALRSIRLALGLSLDEFSQRIGMSVTELDAYERGDKAIDAARMSGALERLAPDVQALAGADALAAFARRAGNHADN